MWTSWPLVPMAWKWAPSLNLFLQINGGILYFITFFTRSFVFVHVKYVTRSEERVFDHPGSNNGNMF